MGEFQEEPKAGPPAYMVSFGDMMTLILTFFILLVSMSKEQAVGLTATGIGSFVAELRSYGLSGLLNENEKAAIFDEIRQRFNLPPEEDRDRNEPSTMELLEADDVEALQPHDELLQPAIAMFWADSSELTIESRAYLDLLAMTLRPARAQLLVLEGHASDAGPNHDHDDHLLAFLRAEAVRTYLVDKHGYPASRVQARAWIRELARDEAGSLAVDARLLSPRD